MIQTWTSARDLLTKHHNLFYEANQMMQEQIMKAYLAAQKKEERERKKYEKLKLKFES
jgi:hypothetical protein